MLRHLLVERFALKTRTEVREMPVHVLTIAREDGRLGPDLKRSSDACAAEVEARRLRGEGPPPLGPPPESSDAMYQLLRTPRCGAVTATSTAGRGFTVAAGGTPLSAVVTRISSEVSGPVVDRTGLTGLFDFVLEFDSPKRRPLPAGLSLPDDRSPFPPLRDALQRQLGLRLEQEPGPVEILVIEAARHPTPN